ncbi:MAG: hypothetical protein AAFZ63_17200, partial [Bacteroidota bacterium]
MHHNILDEAEKHTGPRTCPNCGYQFPFGKFVRRYVVSFGLSKWKCHACREVIKCDFIKLQFYWLLALLPCGFLFGVLDGYFDLGLFNIVFLLP